MIICEIFVIFSLFFTTVEKLLVAGIKETGAIKGPNKPYVLAEFDDEKTPTGYRFEFPSCAVTKSNEENGEIKFSAAGDSFEMLYLCYPMQISDCVIAGATRFMNHYCAFNEKPNCGVEGNYEYVMKNALDKAGNKMTCAKTKDNAKLYRVGYNFQFVPGESNVKDVYNFCYSREKEKTLYVEYKIISPDLLSNSKVNDNTYHKKIETTSFDKKELGDFEKKIAYFRTKPNPDWGINLLVPPQHMALEWWKEPLFHIVNVQLLRAKFHTEMNVINNYIRDKAIEVFGEVFIRAGVFDVSDYTYDSYVWWKLIYDESREYAIALFIHNELTPPNQKLCGKKLKYSCFSYGWQDIVPPTISEFVYCCTPSYLVKMYDFPPVKTFNLRGPLSENTTYAGKRKNCKVLKETDSLNARIAKKQKPDSSSNKIPAAAN